MVLAAFWLMKTPVWFAITLRKTVIDEPRTVTPIPCGCPGTADARPSGVVPKRLCMTIAPVPSMSTPVTEVPEMTLRRPVLPITFAPPEVTPQPTVGAERAAPSGWRPM